MCEKERLAAPDVGRADAGTCATLVAAAALARTTAGIAERHTRALVQDARRGAAIRGLRTPGTVAVRHAALAVPARVGLATRAAVGGARLAGPEAHRCTTRACRVGRRCVGSGVRAGGIRRSAAGRRSVALSARAARRASAGSRASSAGARPCRALRSAVRRCVVAAGSVLHVAFARAACADDDEDEARDGSRA
jgi:hypothetical protein